MKEAYETPKIAIIGLEVSDIITASEDIGEWDF